MKKIFYLFIYFSIIYCAAAQNEANIWYFGGKAGLDFNGGPPVALTDGSMNTQEGCASISDSTGKLLFYTDGNRVWNRNHLLMPNGDGLYGDESSTQSAIIVPHPGHEDLYYIFTVDDMAPVGHTGLNYSQVDMSLDNGLGDVDLLNRNLMTDSPEKVTAIKHANNNDVWLITHPWNSREFNVYLIDGNGISQAPVTSASQNEYSDKVELDKAGYMKASSDGKKLAVALSGRKIVELYDFDFRTGELTPFSLIRTNGMPYGLEFSPDGKMLYVSTDRDFLSSLLYQYDISSGNLGEIEESKVLISSVNKPVFYGAIQIGPDRKIYVAQHNHRDDSHYLGVINNPNTYGFGCGFDTQGMFLEEGNSRRGLPTFIQSYFQPDIKITTNSPVCAGDELVLEASLENDAKYIWTTPNGLIKEGRIVTFQNVSKDFEGEYLLKVEFIDGTFKEIIFDVEIIDVEFAIEGLDDSTFSKVCAGESVTKTFKFRNTGDDHIELTSLRTEGGGGSFVVSSDPPVKTTVQPDEAIDIILTFTPAVPGDFTGEVVFEVTYPCELIKRITVTGSAEERTIVHFPHLAGLVGTKNFSLPLYARIDCNPDFERTISFRAVVSYDIDAFMADDSPVIKSRRYELEKEVLEIEAEDVLIDAEDKVIADIRGTILLTFDDYTPLTIEEFEWSVAGIENDTINGSLTTIGTCQHDLRKISLIYLPNMSVAPNPATESTLVKLLIPSPGEYSLDVTTLQGEQVDLMKWNFGPSETYPVEKEIRLDLTDYPSGVYLVRYFNPFKILVARLTVAK